MTGKTNPDPALRKEGFRTELEYKRDMAFATRDALGDQIFDEGRNPTEAEFDVLDQLTGKANGYQELVDTFFRPIIKVEKPVWLKELLY